jgi:hypothetical protein
MGEEDLPGASISERTVRILLIESDPKGVIV